MPDTPRKSRKDEAGLLPLSRAGPYAGSVRVVAHALQHDDDDDAGAVLQWRLPVALVGHGLDF